MWVNEEMDKVMTAGYDSRDKYNYLFDEYQLDGKEWNRIVMHLE